ncbi:class II glutamine amidotransferase [soil metagenome]
MGLIGAYALDVMSMCRLLGIVASESVHFRALLTERPQKLHGQRYVSLASLGAEHGDGWGLASCAGGRWQVHKGTRAASLDESFHREACGLRGELLVSHVRKRTVGATRTENSHPFVRDRWVFAHNGTIDHRAWLTDHLSPKRRDEIAGDTDSELFFAYILTRLDAAELTACAAQAATDDVVASIASECRARARFGSFNFLLSDGASFYVHRFGRGLHLLERGPRDAGPNRRTRAVFVASEPMTGEPWAEMADGSLLRIDGGASPRIRAIG